MRPQRKPILNLPKTCLTTRLQVYRAILRRENGRGAMDCDRIQSLQFGGFVRKSVTSRALPNGRQLF